MGGALTGNSSPHPAGHTRASWLCCLRSLQTNLLCTLPGPNPLTLQTELCPASLLCVSVSLHVSPSLCPCISVSLARLCVSPSPSPPALCSTSRKGHTPSLGSPSWAGLVTAGEPDREAGTGEVDTAGLGTPLRNRGQTAGGKWEGRKFG